MIQQAAQACLAQEGGPYEMVFSDDASTDATYLKLQEVAAGYQGPHRLVLRRNSVNAGIGGHYNQAIAASSGELIITAAGDDISMPHRVSRLVAAWDATGRKADLIASHVIDMDNQGVLHGVVQVDDLGRYRGLDDWLTHRPYVIGAGHAFTRRLLDRFGPMSARLAYEDQIMVFRAVVMGGAITVDEPLVHYRRGGVSGRPVFESAAHMLRWNARQLNHHIAEMEQLVADADAIDCGDRVRNALGFALQRAIYQNNLWKAASQGERWSLLKEAGHLPLPWRVRKFVHVSLPQTAWMVKRCLSIFHNR
jgi:glycosyltransferase involved in cell wall biosynthesis